jgi:hypothetical protein
MRIKINKDRVWYVPSRKKYFTKCYICDELLEGFTSKEVIKEANRRDWEYDTETKEILCNSCKDCKKEKKWE